MESLKTYIASQEEKLSKMLGKRKCLECDNEIMGKGYCSTDCVAKAFAKELAGNVKTETKPQTCNCVFNNRQVFCDNSCRYWTEA